MDIINVISTPTGGAISPALLCEVFNYYKFRLQAVKPGLRSVLLKEASRIIRALNRLKLELTKPGESFIARLLNVRHKARLKAAYGLMEDRLRTWLNKTLAAYCS